MAILRRPNCCGDSRIKCFIIGYINLIVAIIDIALHFFVLAAVSRGFECDVDMSLFQLSPLNVPWLGPVLFFLNLGTHGFYQFPIIFPFFNNAHTQLPPPAQPRCYPGMIHMNQIDILNFLINAIWIKFVISFVCAVHKKDPVTMRMFYGLSVVKLVLQAMYFAYQPYTHYNIPMETYWFFALVDICIASGFLCIINNYIKELFREKAQQVVDQPPPYIECLINAAQSKKEEKSVEALQPTEQKIEVPSDAAPVARA